MLHYNLYKKAFGNNVSILHVDNFSGQSENNTNYGGVYIMMYFREIFFSSEPHIFLLISFFGITGFDIAKVVNMFHAF